MDTAKDVLLKIEEGKTEENPQEAEINILCFNISGYNELSQFLLCAAFVFICYLPYGYLQEILYSSPGVELVNLFITLVQFTIISFLSFIESLLREHTKRKAPLKTYALLAALTLGTMSLTNLSLSYLNYPTATIFKSCKVIPVMIGSITIMGKKYRYLDYVAAVVMCFGLTMFTLADNNTSPKFEVFGVLLISIALLCDAVIGNVSEKTIKRFQASNNEVVLYSYAIGSTYLTVITLFTGVLVDGIQYCDTAPTIYIKIFLLSVCSYMGLQAILTSVRTCGATVTSVITTLRKALSIILSFVIFGKPFVLQYVWSSLLVGLAIYLFIYSKKRQNIRLGFPIAPSRMTQNTRL